MADGLIAYRFILLALIILLNGFFAGAEVALLSSRRSRLSQLAESGNVGAQAALSLLAHPERLLSVVQLGVTLSSLGLGWAGEETVFGILIGLFQPVMTPATNSLLHGIAFALSFAIMSFAHVVLGEVVPKNLAIEKSDRLAVLVAPVLLVFYRVSEPFVAAIEKSASSLSRLLGIKEQSTGGGHSAEELKFIVSSSRTEGHLQGIEEDVIRHALDLQNFAVREIMIPRNHVIGVSADATLDQVLRTFLDHQYSRLPVYEDQPESIIGILHYKDLMRVWLERKNALERRRPAAPFRVRQLVRKPLVFPETKLLNQLLDEFRQYHTHMALVVDEFGTISGVVTLEDVLEQLVGKIADEHDETPIIPLPESQVLEVEGTTSLRSLGAEYGIELPTDGNFETLAGFILHELGEIPKAGTILERHQRRFTVVDMDRNRIARVRIEKLEPEPVLVTQS
jgi:putative hemolysin